ncbi:MAG: ferredoxin [Usitatibacter sp.]
MTGLRGAGASEPADARNLRPALAARYRNLAALRYDFPLVLPQEPAGEEFVLSLSSVVDRLIDQIAPAGAEGERLRKNVLRIEREIRVLLAQGASGTLFHLWDLAARRRAARGHQALGPAAVRARAALKPDGEVLDCGESLPAQYLLQAWKGVRQRKDARFHEEIDRLVLRLAEILQADAVRSTAGRSAEKLKGSMGTVHRDAFDFEAMSKLLGRGPAGRSLTESRRRRIRSLLVALESQRFFLDASGYTFVFDRCAPALKAFRARLPRLVELARSVAIAKLEADGEYVESRHDALFKEFQESTLTPEDLAQFPDYLVCLNESDLDAAGQADLVELLCSGIPAKILLQSDDLFGGADKPDPLSAVGARGQAIAGMAIGLNEVFVLQSSASNLVQLRGRVLKGLAHPGPALFSVFSGASGDSACLPPYLNAAAAMESRAFPAFTYDPAKDLEVESRFSLENNPQADRDWPVHAFAYEDEEHQRASESMSLTLADFLAADARYARHFLKVPRGTPGVVPIAEWLDGEGGAAADALPSVSMVDENNALHSLVAGEPVVLQMRRCRDRWRRLQRLAAVSQPAAQAIVVPAAPQETVAVPAAPPVPAAPVEAEKAPTSDAPYIETPRCTSCDECTHLNNRLFAYDANKQAYIANVEAGTYRELVEAAESCQVSIIHPGKPRNPDEPGLAELLERAAPFL